MADPLFDKICDLANEACAEAKAMHSEQRNRMGAVNWADLGAGDVLRCENRDGEVTWVVEIGEASPSSTLLSYVGFYIAHHLPGIPVEVRAEW